MIYIGCFFIGVLFINGIPHFVQGVSGNPFQSPFAKPPGIGESPPLVNALWGGFNFIAGYALLKYVGFFELGINLCTLALVSGGLITAVGLAIHFGKVRNR